MKVTLPTYMYCAYVYTHCNVAFEKFNALEVAQQVKPLAMKTWWAESDSAGTMVGGENLLPKIVHWAVNSHCGKFMPIFKHRHTHTH